MFEHPCSNTVLRGTTVATLQIQYAESVLETYGQQVVVFVG